MDRRIVALMSIKSLRAPQWLFLLGLFGILSPKVEAQELKCSVSVDISQLQGPSYTHLRDLQAPLSEYLSDFSWTEDVFEEVEQIDCRFQLSFQEAISLTQFRVRLVASIRRPIYGTAQLTNVITINDENWIFNYAQGAPLIHDINRFDRLTSVLDYYAYILLGYDYDTFSELGGTPLFEKARVVADLAKSSGSSGWESTAGQDGRIKLLDELLDPRYRAVRETQFQYHLDGLDKFVQAPDDARQAALEALKNMLDLQATGTRSMLMDLFFASKSDELASMFAQSLMASEAYEVLTQLDPSRMSTYNKMVD